MSDFNDPGLTPDDAAERRRPSGSRFGDISDRLARTFGGFERTRAELPAWEANGGLEYPPVAEQEPAREAAQAQFPTTRHGYDPSAVEQHVAELEHELADLRGRTPAEIERIGEQTAAILLVAHEQAQEIKRDAQQQADGCLSDAASNAVSITEDAKRRLTELDAETDAVWQERARLLDDARNVATALFTLVEDAHERFPPESDKTAAAASPPAPIAAAPAEPVGQES